MCVVSINIAAQCYDIYVIAMTKDQIIRSQSETSTSLGNIQTKI